MFRSFVFIVVVLAGMCIRGAEFRGLVLLNELEGPPLANVAISADDAQPKISGSDGRFDLVFPNRQPGQVVEIVASKNGYVVIHSILLQHTLLKDVTGQRARILMAREGDREEMARRFFRLKGDEAALKHYQERVAELERQHQADAANLARLREELESARAAAARAAEDFARDAGKENSTLYRQALELFLDGKSDAALEILDEAKLQKRKQEAQNMALQVSQEFQLKGKLLTLKFRFAEAALAYKSAVETAPNNYEANFAFGCFLQSLNQQKDALVAYSRALDLAHKADDPVYVAITLNNLGILHRAENRMVEARKAFENVLMIYRQLAEKNPEIYLPDVATTLNNIGNLHRTENRMAEARIAFEEALRIRRKLTEKNPDTYQPYMANSLNSLGNLHRDENRKNEARIAFEEALKIYRQLAEKNLDTYQPDLANTLNNLGLLCRDEDHMAEARTAFEEALNIYRQLAEKNPDAYQPYLANTLNNLGSLHRAEKQMVEARKAFEEALDIYRHLVAKNPDTYQSYLANTLNNLGNLHRAEKRMPEARKALEEALDIRRQLTEKNPNTYWPYLANTLKNLGLLYGDENLIPEARKAYEESLKIYHQLAKMAPGKFDSDVLRVQLLLKTLDK